MFFIIDCYFVAGDDDDDEQQNFDVGVAVGVDVGVGDGAVAADVDVDVGVEGDVDCCLDSDDEFCDESCFGNVDGIVCVEQWETIQFCYEMVVYVLVHLGAVIDVVDDVRHHDDDVTVYVGCNLCDTFF